MINHIKISDLIAKNVIIKKDSYPKIPLLMISIQSHLPSLNSTGLLTRGNIKNSTTITI